MRSNPIVAMCVKQRQRKMNSLLHIDELGEIGNNVPRSQGFRRIPGGPKHFHRPRDIPLVHLAVARNTGQNRLRSRQTIAGALETLKGNECWLKQGYKTRMNIHSAISFNLNNQAYDNNCGSPFLLRGNIWNILLFQKMMQVILQPFYKKQRQCIVQRTFSNLAASELAHSL